jgi:hypothetical protein
VFYFHFAGWILLIVGLSGVIVFGLLLRQASKTPSEPDANDLLLKDMGRWQYLVFLLIALIVAGMGKGFIVYKP